MSVLRTEWPQANAGGSIGKRRLAWMTNGKEGKRFGGETPTDARLFCRAFGHGRACKRQAHIYRRSTAALVPRSLSSQGTQHQACSSWDLAARLRPGRRAGVTRPYLSQSSEA